MTHGIAVLGSTGSIGRQALDVARFLGVPVRALSAGGSNIDLLYEQIREFLPEIAHVASSDAALSLRKRIMGDGARGVRIRTDILTGESGLCAAAAEGSANAVVIAISGSAALPAVIATIRSGRRVALANKESIVMAGRIVTELAKERHNPPIPVDSEHSAIFQCLAGRNISNVNMSNSDDIRRIILTASGGPFREYSAGKLSEITPEQAAAHPVWSMGRKISIDSATLMNKGLEVIEASWLFGVRADKIDVVIHPESIIHSMVEFADNSVIAQMGAPDMRTAIQYALTYPERLAGLAESLSFADIGKLTFEQPDCTRFPCLKLAYDALAAGGTMPAVYNAANEAAVTLFLRGQAGFCDIPRLVALAMERHTPMSDLSLDNILAADADARNWVLKH